MYKRQVKDEYFERFKSNYFTDNKSENRPYYLSFKDKDNIIWLIPLSSQTANYQSKINHDIGKRGECLFYYIDKIHGEDRAFLIGNMFPVTQEYVLDAYAGISLASL